LTTGGLDDETFARAIETIDRNAKHVPKPVEPAELAVVIASLTTQHRR